MGGDEGMLRGRRAVVTGGSSGIGVEIVRALAGAGAEVVVPVRNREKGERALAGIRSADPDARVELADLDLARLDTVRALAASLREQDPIDVLVLNAGTVAVGEHGPHATVDGFEPTFQTNLLGHAVLTLGMLPVLRAGRARVVVQSSVVAARGRIDGAGEPAAGARIHPFHAYRTSKIALGLFGMELARRSAAADWGVTVQFCHPGIAPGSAIAPGIRAMLPAGLVRWASAHLGNPPSLAAQTALAAATSPAAAPRMFVPRGPFALMGRPRERAPFASFADPVAARRLWDEAAQASAD